MRGLRKTDIPVSVGGVIGDGIFTLISCSLACFCYICTKRKGAFACCGESRVRVRHTPDIRCGIRAQAGGFPSGQGAFPITNHPTNENDPVACRAAGRDGRPSRSGRRLGRRFGPAPDALREWSVEETDALLSGLLAAYDDSWEALSRFRFSFVRYAPRGYDRSRSRFLLAGVDLADPATGAVRWGAMTALREARVSGSVSGGVLPGTFALGAEAGLGEFEADPAADVRGGRFGWMFAERRFRYGLRVGGSTGLMRGGWAVSAAVSRRWGHDARIPGRLFRRLDRLCGGRQTLGRASFADGVVRRGSFRAGASQCDGSRGLPR